MKRKKLGTTAEYLFQRRVKSYKLDAIIQIIQLLFLMSILILIILLPRINHAYGFIQTNDEACKYSFVVTYTVCLFIYILFIILNLYFGIEIIINGFKNPEGEAAKEFLKLFKSE